MYALRILKSHGLPKASVQEVTRATNLARLMYAVSAWWGYAEYAQTSIRSRLDRTIAGTVRNGCLPRETSKFGEMVHVAENGLLSHTPTIMSSYHQQFSAVLASTPRHIPLP